MRLPVMLLLLLFATPAVVPATAGPVEDLEAETHDCRTMLAVFPPRDQCVLDGRGAACASQLGPAYGLRCWIVGHDCGFGAWSLDLDPVRFAGRHACDGGVTVTP